MASTHERLARLRAFGLSDYASRAYLSLLQLGETEAREIAQAAGIPVAKVYQTLDQLQERGLAVTYPTTPKRYAPVPIAEFVDKQRDFHEAQARELEAQVDELSEMFTLSRADLFSDRGGIHVIKGRRENLQAIRKAFARASQEILLGPAEGWLVHRRQARMLVEEVVARGISMRLLVPPSPAALQAAHALAGQVETRERDRMVDGTSATSIMVVDGRMALMTHFIPDDGSSNRGQDVGILIEEAALVRAILSLLESHWMGARTIAPHV